MKKDYLELVRLIIEDQLTLEAFISLNGVNQFAADEELEHLSPVAYTYTSAPKPIYFFKSADFPNLGLLFHYSKLFTFAKGGSPYKEDEMSEYDTRTEYPYIQAAVYDPDRRSFVAGLRFLSHKDISYSMSAMSQLFYAHMTMESILSESLEIGQTFVLPEVGTLGGSYLFSVMASIIALTPARFLLGKPTIEGRMSDVSKEIISSFAYDAFNPHENTVLNPLSANLLSAATGIFAPSLRPLSIIVKQYNDEIRRMKHQHPQLDYQANMSVQQKRKITTQLLLYYGGTLPPMFKFYSILTEEKGMIVLSPSVINPLYTTKSWEFPILLDKQKIASIHKNILEYYLNYFQDKTIIY